VVELQILYIAQCAEVITDLCSLYDIDLVDLIGQHHSCRSCT
jgi:hypothetical protein